MTTERRQYNAQEIEQMNNAGDQLIANGLDDSPTGNQHNVDVIDAYFQENQAIPVTVANVFKCVEAKKQAFKWLSPAQHEYNRVANQEPERANALSAWLQTQGKVGQLVSQGDEAFENLRLLLLTLRGYQIDATTISHAMDRVQSKPGPKLHFVQATRRTEPVSPAAKADDGQPFLGRNLNEPEWARRSRERSERDAREAASRQSAASVQSAATREARTKAEELRGNTHAESEQLGRVFVTEGTEINWPATLQARLALQRNFQKAQEVRRFVR